MVSRRSFLRMLGTAGILPLFPTCEFAPVSHPSSSSGSASPIDRKALLDRHSPRITSADPAAVLSLGNGRFAFNVDCTGLQTLQAEYKTIPLATLSHWAWHSFPLPQGLSPDALHYKQWPFHGRLVPYATDASVRGGGSGGGGPQSAIFNYLRENPHRLNLGRVRLLFNDRPIASAQLSDIDQQLDLQTGLLASRFSLAGMPVEVRTCCHAEFDGIGIRITSPLLAQSQASQLVLEISFGYGSSTFGGDGADFTRPDAHSTTVYRDPRAPSQVTLNRELDDTRYGVRIAWQGAANFRESAPHTFLVNATTGDSLELVINFDTESFRATPLYRFADAQRSAELSWRDFWASGAAIDLSACTDPRAPELERRIVLSQYLTAIHCAGIYPSQETGLLCNSWYGKFHLEMHWWHSVHFAAWNRQRLFGRSMFIYTKFLESARKRAAFQGFKGARWPKMTGPDGNDSPSSVGPLILWQQPHPIYFAELCYRNDPTSDTLRRWRDIVLATADFMASFAWFDEARGQYVLGPIIKTVSENNPTETTFNPTYELTAWRFGLSTAQKWLERLGERRNLDWDKVLAKLAPAPIADGAYQMQENMPTFTKEWAWEHPALLGAYGVLPGDGIDPQIMAETVRRVRATWDFTRVWGWDFPVCAMAAARTGQPDLAIDFLTMDAPMNRYLKNGVNFQRDNVPAYFPGNGGLLAAIALMSAGWNNGPDTPLPGWPKNGKWNVKAEGFNHWV